MKPLNKRVNKRKASKVTLKTHHVHDAHATAQIEAKEGLAGNPAIRSEDIHMHNS